MTPWTGVRAVAAWALVFVALFWAAAGGFEARASASASDRSGRFAQLGRPRRVSPTVESTGGSSIGPPSRK